MEKENYNEENFNHEIKESEKNNEEKRVSDLMLQEHGRISKKINLIQNNLGEPSEELSVLLKELKKDLEEHFHIEEEAIFDLYDKISGSEEVADTFELMQEHGEILGNIKHIQNDLEKHREHGKEKSVEVKNEETSRNHLIALKEKINQHIEFENHTFYRDLDEKLDKQEKDDLIREVEVTRKKRENREGTEEDKKQNS